jgi:hypothetical protein
MGGTYQGDGLAKPADQMHVHRDGWHSLAFLHDWQDGLITERAVYADLLAFIWQQMQSGEDPVALNDAYSKLLLMLNLRETIPGNQLRGFHLYVWKKRGVFKNMLSREYGPKNSIGRNDLTGAALSWKISSRSEALRDAETYLKTGSPFGNAYAEMTGGGETASHPRHGASGGGRGVPAALYFCRRRGEGLLWRSSKKPQAAFWVGRIRDWSAGRLLLRNPQACATSCGSMRKRAVAGREFRRTMHIWTARANRSIGSRRLLFLCSAAHRRPGYIDGATDRKDWEWNTI